MTLWFVRKEADREVNALEGASFPVRTKCYGAVDPFRLIPRLRSPMSPPTPEKSDRCPDMFTFLLVVHAIIAALLVTVILMQRSEGGGLTTGGSPSGLMSARGAADFLTRSTAILAGLFIAMSILLAVLAATRHDAIDTSLARPAAPAAAVPAAAAAPDAGAPANLAAPAPAENGVVPIAR
jgi:preprotein translocase subunit SecG